MPSSANVSFVYFQVSSQLSTDESASITGYFQLFQTGRAKRFLSNLAVTEQGGALQRVKSSQTESKDARRV